MKIAVGDKVAFSANFLRSIGARTGPMGFARGTVESIKKMGPLDIATVNWGKWTDDASPRVNIKNLARVGTPAMSSN
jgi:hypothetical protein